MSDGWFALGGVVLGGGITGLWQWLQVRSSRAESRRAERIDLVSGILADAEQLWKGVNYLANAIANIQGFPADSMGEQQRQEAFAIISPARASLTLALARTQLLCPALFGDAQELFEAAERVRLSAYELDHDRYARAVASFVAAAQHVVAD